MISLCFRDTDETDSKKSLEIRDLLLAHGADPSIKNKDGEAALQMAEGLKLEPQFIEKLRLRSG